MMGFSGMHILVLAICSLAWVTATPVANDRRVIIGYRTMDLGQEKKWMQNGNTVTPDENNGGYQIGKGIYTSPKAGDWVKDSRAWICRISASANAWYLADKIWIPKTWEGKNLWESGKSVKDQDDYIRSFGLGYDPSKVFRFSLIDRFEDMLQMVIPQAMTNSKGGGMDLSVECQPSTSPVWEKEDIVDYYSWTNVQTGKPPYDGLKQVLKGDPQFSSNNRYGLNQCYNNS